MTNRHTKLVLTLSVLAAALICIVSYRQHTHQQITSRVFEQTSGWGYDILVNDSLFIHQHVMPAVTSNRGFATREQANKAAMLVTSKLKSGRLPVITKQELEDICR